MEVTDDYIMYRPADVGPRQSRYFLLHFELLAELGLCKRILIILSESGPQMLASEND